MREERVDSGTAPERQAGRAAQRAAGAIAIVLGALVVAAGLATGPAAGLEEDVTQVVGLEPIGPPRYGGDRCPTQGHWWNFRLAPDDGSVAFREITLNLAGTTRAFSGAELVPYGGAGDVLVQVPRGHGLDELRRDGSSAVVTTSGADLVPSFSLGFICYGALTPTPTTVPPPSGPSVDGVCYDVDVAGGVLRYWHRLENDGDADLDVTWADGSATIPANGTVTVPSANDTITLMIQGETVATTEASPDEVCTGTVRVTKRIAGPERTDGDSAPVYTIRISRLVGAAYVPEAEPFQLVGGQTVEIPLPSTFNPEGVQYLIEEIDAGDADAVSITPQTFVLNGHRAETIDVRITNAFAAIQLDKSVDKSIAQPGDELVYTLVAENTGGVRLDRISIYDRLPAEVTLTGSEVAGGAGSCTLVESGTPQLVRCDLDDSLPPGGRTPDVRLVTVVSADVAVDESIVNQAAAVGDFEGRPDIDLSRRNRAAGRELTCFPTVGQVCDLAAAASGVLGPGPVVTPPTTVAAPATPTTVVSDAAATTTVPFRLPATGATNGAVSALGGVLVLIGGVLVVGTRRQHRTTAD